MSEKQPVSQRALNTDELLDRLAEAGGKLTAEEDVLFKGTKLVIPEVMNLADAARFINEKISEDEREMEFNRVYNFRPWDGARATMRALKVAFGMVSQRVTPGFFGDSPPKLITINIGVNETEQVPWGRMAIPMLPGMDFDLGSVNHPEHGILFSISATGPRKYRHHVEGVFNLIGRELERESLYRGKAFDGQSNPEFLDLSTVSRDKVIYAEDVMTQLEANVWSLIRYTDKMEKLGISLKRAVLFEGPFGTGKTLGAFLTAQIAVQNGWSFIYCRPGRDNLRAVMATARLYQPACVFFEDVDTVAASDSGTGDHVTELLDIFDGIQSKGTKILCVLTTNNVDTIHKGMVRPGRLDAMIHIGALDINGIERMGKAVLDPSFLDEDVDWQVVGEAMVGFLPAFVKEALERAVRYSVARNEGEPSVLSTADFVAAAEGLRPQLDLMNDADDTAPRDPLGIAMEKSLANALNRTNLQLDEDGISLVAKGEENALTR
jgi:hypothetical protein